MKVVCDRSALGDAINLVSGVAAQRTPRPQLQCVRVSARKSGKAGQLTLAATDAEISLRLETSSVDVQEPGDSLVPADKLRAIVSAEDAEATLTLATDADALEIKGADAKFKILGYPAAEFPPLPDFDRIASGKDPGLKAAFSHPGGALMAMIARTLFATARENSRYAINGVLLRREGKKFEMVATDGRRLALARQAIQTKDGDQHAVSCIVPTKALAMLQRLIQDPEAPVQVAVTDTQILFSVGGGEGGGRAVLTSNLVEGTFPPYEDVIPKDQDKKVVFDRDVLASAVRRAALLTNEESRGVRLKFNADQKQVELSSRAPEMGEAQVTVDVASFEGGDIEIGFNPSFIVDALKVIPDTEVIMELKASNKPGVIKSGQDFVYVVMPVNLH